MDMEIVRKKLVFVGEFLDSYNKLIDQEADMTLTFRMSKTLVADKAGDFKAQYDSTVRQRITANENITRMVGASSMDEVRDLYLELLTTYNYWGQIREHLRIAETELALFGEVKSTELIIRGDNPVEELREALEKAENICGKVVSLIRVPINGDADSDIQIVKNIQGA